MKTTLKSAAKALTTKKKLNIGSFFSSFFSTKKPLTTKRPLTTKKPLTTIKPLTTKKPAESKPLSPYANRDAVITGWGVQADSK